MGGGGSYKTLLNTSPATDIIQTVPQAGKDAVLLDSKPDKDLVKFEL